MNKFIAVTAATLAISLAAPAMAASNAECETHWSKLDTGKTGYVMTSNAKDHHEMMRKAGRKTAAADRITDKEFMDSCLADIFAKSSQ
jgi:hypothetical protein